MELRYKIKEIPTDGMACDQALSAELLKEALVGLEPELAHCSGSVQLMLNRTTRTEIVVSGRISASLAVACGACLKPATLLVRVPVTAVFVEGDEAEEREETDDPNAADVLHHDGVWLDLEPLVREQLILSLPMSPRCKEGCKGLCSVCGEDRNLTDCGHKIEFGDPRLAALKSLKQELKDQKG